jgi:8-oxo-dGTP pyrophosphatase MutT (NUDIX family)
MNSVWQEEQAKFEVETATKKKEKKKDKYKIEWPPGCDKYGAGFAFCFGGDGGDSAEIFLLKRSATSGNPLTWGLPGGNVDKTDESLLFTAQRESIEEMAKLPESYEVIKEVTTRRGKRMQKWYRVFVARVSKEDRENFQPVLNDEHIEYKWVEVSKLSDLGIHPVVQLLFSSAGELPMSDFVALVKP